jgi:hypothetical protein
MYGAHLLKVFDLLHLLRGNAILIFQRYLPLLPNAHSNKSKQGKLLKKRNMKKVLVHTPSLFFYISVSELKPHHFSGAGAVTKCSSCSKRNVQHR